MPGFRDGLSLSQDQAVVKLRYLSSFYKNASDETFTGVHLETEQWHGHILRCVCQSKMFSVETA